MTTNEIAAEAARHVCESGAPGALAHNTKVIADAIAQAMAVTGTQSPETPLAECARYHEGQAEGLRIFERIGWKNSPAAHDIAMHERFAVACREADGK